MASAHVPIGENDVRKLIRNTVSEHRRIIFNGDGYSAEWREEAEKRGLLNLENTATALPLLSKKENIELFLRHGVFNETELKCREEIRLENYCKTVHIEARTLLQMVKRDVIPAISRYTGALCECICNKKNTDDKIDCTVEEDLAKRLSEKNTQLFNLAGVLSNAKKEAKKIKNVSDKAVFYHDNILSVMKQIRDITDKAETEVERGYWPYPTYGDLLFKIQ